MLLTLHPGDRVLTAGLGRDRTRTTRRAARRARVAVVVDVGVAEVAVAGCEPGSVGFARWVAELGQRIDECGLAATADDVATLIGTARHHGVALVAAGVLADSTQPEPARHRAFAHVVSALVAPPPPICA